MVREGERVMGEDVCVCTLSASLLHVKVNGKNRAMIIPGNHLASSLHSDEADFPLTVDTLVGKVYCSHTINHVHLITGAAPPTHIACDDVELITGSPPPHITVTGCLPYNLFNLILSNHGCTWTCCSILWAADIFTVCSRTERICTMYWVCMCWLRAVRDRYRMSSVYILSQDWKLYLRF